MGIPAKKKKGLKHMFELLMDNNFLKLMSQQTTDSGSSENTKWNT